MIVSRSIAGAADLAMNDADAFGVIAAQVKAGLRPRPDQGRARAESGTTRAGTVLLRRKVSGFPLALDRTRFPTIPGEVLLCDA